jgi:outer membrane protein OmpU
MKKSLYMTTALVAAGVMTLGVSGAMAAEKIKPVTIKVGGAMKALVGYSDQSGSYTNLNTSTVRNGYDGFNQLNDSEIHFTGSTKLDNGIAIAVTVQLEADHFEDNGKGNSIDESYMALSGNFGTLRLGSSKGVTALMAKNGPNTGAIGLGNPDTDNWIVRPTAVGNGAGTTGGIGNAALSTSQGGGDNMKAVYMSPSFSGFVLGAGYTASNTNSDGMPLVGGTGGVETQTYAGDIQYSTKFNSASIGVDMGYWETHGQASDSSRSHRVGIKVGFGPWTIGTSRKEAKDADNTSDQQAHDTYEAGLQWKGGDWTLGVQMMNASSNQSALVSGDDEVTKYSVGAVYNMGPGVDLVGTIAHVNWEDELKNNTANNNSGVAVVGGVSVRF